MKTATRKLTRVCKSSSVVVACLLLSVFSENMYAITDALKIRIAGNNYSDETIIRFMPGVTVEYDACCDAYKLFSMNSNVPNIFTKTPLGDNLTINALPPLTTLYNTGLLLRIGACGNYTFKSEEMGAFDSGVCILMFDQFTGIIYNLRDTSVSNIIHLSVTSENDAARFILVFSVPATVITTAPTCYGCTNGKATIKKAGWTNWEYTINDSLGNFITSGTPSSDSIILTDFSVGYYNVIVQSQSFSCTDSQWFRVNGFGINSATGINTNSFNSEYKLSYYNDAFRIEINFDEEKNFTAQIIDMQGKNIWKNDFQNTKQLKQSVEIANLAPGIYAGMIQGKDFSVVKKIIISR